MSVTELTDIGAQAGQSPKRYAPQWLERIDALLDVHRSHFLFREPTPAELEVHKAVLALGIQTGILINALIDDPAVSLRLQLLKDAYTIFHDSTFSEPAAERRLEEVFPE